MIKPISPEEVGEAKTQIIPEGVFTAFNNRIAMHFTTGRAVVKQDDVIADLIKVGFTRHELFTNGWLNIEEAYEAAGWKVEYDKPAYNETGYAVFTFIKKVNNR